MVEINVRTISITNLIEPVYMDDSIFKLQNYIGK